MIKGTHIETTLGLLDTVMLLMHCREYHSIIGSNVIMSLSIIGITLSFEVRFQLSRERGEVVDSFWHRLELKWSMPEFV